MHLYNKLGVIGLSLDDLMHGQSAVLARSVKGEIVPDKFVEVSLGLAERYINLYKQKHSEGIDIGGIVTNIRQYEFNARAEHLLERHGINKMDKHRHLALARWYNEFFVKYYVLTQMEKMQPYLEHLSEAIEHGDALTLLETVNVFNDAIRKGEIKHAERYLLGIPSQDVLRYYSEAPQKYKSKQLVEYW